MRPHYQKGDKLRATVNNFRLIKGNIYTFKEYHHNYPYERGEEAGIYLEEDRDAWYVRNFEPLPVEE